MALLVDKHRPRNLEALSYHPDLSDRLRALAQSGDFPHLLVYGPSGAGKKTRIVATLKELYGPGVEKIKIDARVFQTTTNRKLEFNIVASVYHLEITPSDVGNYDRVVVQDLLKEVAQTQQVDLGAKQRFKVVVINEADHLTRDAQAALRRTMEKYSPNLRLILVANSTSNIIAPIRSRTLLVRVAAPTESEICDVLSKVGKKEGWKDVESLNQRIARDSGRNLRKALLMFEAVHAQNEKITDQTHIPPPDWEALIEQIARQIVEERSPQRLLQVRASLYDLLSHCIDSTTIIKTLTWKLIPKTDDALKPEVIKWAAFYEHRCKIGSKQIFHLEAFVAKYMRLYESSTTPMSDKLMDTEPGGERQNQYEGVHTFVEPHAKQAGQLGDSSTGTSVNTKTRDPGAPNTHGITPADKIRYGQSIQEGGMGGKTTSSTGEAKSDTGFGGTKALAEDDDESAAKQRREQGYGGDKDMDRTIGA
ncbi:replication factor c subunit 5 [Pyrenophora seminiperda CCB06]|uniref:Replication factor C subunit 5 n=1 Tax=Pyrenophora seminiperda CCB06 TaxID=1302712 RepID=A0A3M7MIN6_9PLEO|nr:replication factor c subunit 5 [Pyrenophora seminiperda CCB06]